MIMDVQIILWRAIEPHSGSNCRSKTRNYNSRSKPNGSRVFRTIKISISPGLSLGYLSRLIRRAMTNDIGYINDVMARNRAVHSRVKLSIDKSELSALFDLKHQHHPNATRFLEHQPDSFSPHSTFAIRLKLAQVQPPQTLPIQDQRRRSAPGTGAC